MWMELVLLALASGDDSACGPREGRRLPEPPACLAELGELSPALLPGLLPSQRIDLEQLKGALPDLWIGEPEVPFEIYMAPPFESLAARGPGMEVDVARYLEPYEDRGDHILRFSLARQVELPCGLRLGQKFSEFRQKLGNATEWENGNAIYEWRSQECFEGSWGYSTSRITLFLIDGMVVKFEWEPPDGCSAVEDEVAIQQLEAILRGVSKRPPPSQNR